MQAPESPDPTRGDAGPTGPVDAEPEPPAPDASIPEPGPTPPPTPPPVENDPVAVDPATPVTVVPPAKSSAAYAALAEKIARARKIERSVFDAEREVAFGTLGYDPLAAQNLDLILASKVFTLDEGALASLQKHGFVITRDKVPFFNWGYANIYKADLPVYVSADSLMQAVHESYVDILQDVETKVLAPSLSNLTERLRAALASGRGDIGAARVDLDLYLTMARSLLDDYEQQPLFPQNASAVSQLMRAVRAQEVTNVSLFGVDRTIDGSQFKPRGHYASSVELQRYFRAMMWLGRIDFRLLETQPTGDVVFRRRQVEAMFALSDLFDAESTRSFNTIDAVLRDFVGESDYMTPLEVSKLMRDLGALSPADTVRLSNVTIAQAIVDGGYGEQQIASHFMVNEGASGSLPLHRSFALLGQRYVLDSHVFSNVVYDRVPPVAGQMRTMPDPLDVAFAALANDQAASLLTSELDRYAYHGHLNAMRVAADGHDAAYWDANLYNRWLFALRTLSPSARPKGVPQLMSTEPWGKRLLNTQLASWAQLRHDTLLYAKPSYDSGATCEYPDAYVDPYPAFYAALVSYAERGLALTDVLLAVANLQLVDAMRTHFTTLRDVVQTLGAMAEQELTGVPFDEDQLAFINDAVRNVEIGCDGAPGYVGWYPRLFYRPSLTFNPTIADVHTDTNHGRVLHVANGYVQPMILTLETCEGPRAYVGLVSGYHELIAENMERLDDRAWAKQLMEETLPPVAWMRDLVAPAP